MGTLQNLFNRQPQQNNIQANQIMSKLNTQQKNIVFQFMSMPEEQRAEKIAQILNSQGITKEQLQNIIKNFKR